LHAYIRAEFLCPALACAFAGGFERRVGKRGAGVDDFN
jgi:hypothetical protein